MPEKIIAARLSLDSGDANKSVGNFKQQLREANNELLSVSEKFGTTSTQAQNAAKKVAELKDSLGDAADLTNAFNPDRKFQAFSSALQGVVGGFAALQGSMALFGVESEETQKTLLKVQAALALSEGVNSILSAKDAFKNLKVVALDAISGINKALAVTVIGAVVALVATLVTYWDDIKEAVSGVSAEQKKLAEESGKEYELQKQKLSTLNNQDNVLKLQGKTEREILQIKAAQLTNTIEDGKAHLKNQQAILKAQYEAEKRNKEILLGVLNFMGSGLNILLHGIDLAGKAFGKNFGLADKLNNWIASKVFNPEEQKKKADEELKVISDGIADLENQRAGLQLSIRDIDKKAASDRAAQTKEANEREIAAQTELQKKYRELRLAGIEDENDRRRQEIQYQYDDDIEKINALKVTEGTKTELLLAAERTRRQALRGVAEVEAEEDAKAQAERDQRFQDSLKGRGPSSLINTAKSAEQLELERQLLKSQEELKLEDLQNSYYKRLALIQGNEEAELALKKQYEEAKAEVKREAMNQELDLVSTGLSQTSDLIGKQTAVGKVLAIASSIINTYKAANNALATTPFPFNIAAAASIIGIGLANVKRIASVQVQGASGGSPNISPAAPLTPQIATTRLDQASINSVGNSAAGGVNRAFVLVNDVATQQQRIAELNRRARIG